MHPTHPWLHTQVKALLFLVTIGAMFVSTDQFRELGLHLTVLGVPILAGTLSVMFARPHTQPYNVAAFSRVPLRWVAYIVALAFFASAGQPARAELKMPEMPKCPELQLSFGEVSGSGGRKVIATIFPSSVLARACYFPFEPYVKKEWEKTHINSTVGDCKYVGLGGAWDGEVICDVITRVR